MTDLGLTRIYRQIKKKGVKMICLMCGRCVRSLGEDDCKKAVRKRTNS